MSWKQLLQRVTGVHFRKPKKPIETASIDKTSNIDVSKKTPDIDSTNEERHTSYGWHTQFGRLTSDAQSTLIIIGLDFGTAYTKVVVYGEGQRYAIPLRKDKVGVDKYLLPTCVYENAAGKFSLEKSADHCICHSDLKMNILDHTLDRATEQHIITYIARVLQQTRDWVLNEKRDVFGGKRLKWEVNIGLPTENYSDQRLKNTYHRLVGEAWYQSTDKQLRGDDGHRDKDRELDSDLIKEVPEFVAQVQTYYQSPQLKEGVHALIDVGAATTDASIFIVRREPDKYPILAKSVKKLGVNFLNQHRQKENSDETFKPKIQEQLNQVLLVAYKRAPKNSEWDEKIPLMVCGGGARISLYEKFYGQEFIRAVCKTHHGKKLQKYSLPALDQLEIPDIPPKDHDRLSVAHGLSFDLSDSDIINLGSFSPDPILPEKSFSQCPQCKGTGNYGNCPKCEGSGSLKTPVSP